MVSLYFSSQKCKYNAGYGVIIPRMIYRVMESRNTPPFWLYAFLRTGEHPHVEIFDDYSRGHGDFPSEEPVSLRVKSRRNIVLPNEFRDTLGIEDIVAFVGRVKLFEIWNPDAWDEFLKQHEEEYQERLGELERM